MSVPLVSEPATLVTNCVSHYHARKAAGPPSAIPIHSLSDGVWFGANCTGQGRACSEQTRSLQLHLFTTAALVPSRPPQTKTNFYTTPVFFSDLTCFFAMGLAVVNSEH